MSRTKRNVDEFLNHNYHYQNSKRNDEHHKQWLDKMLKDNRKYFEQTFAKYHNINGRNPYGTSAFKHDTKTVKERMANKHQLSRFKMDNEFEVMSNRYMAGKEYWD